MHLSARTGRFRSIMRPACRALAVVALSLFAAVSAVAQFGTTSVGVPRNGAAPPPAAQPLVPLAQRDNLVPTAPAIRRSSTARRSGVPPASERRYVPDEVVIELDGTPSKDQVEALAHRHSLSRIESRVFPLSSTTMYRWHIPDGRPVSDVVRELEADGSVRSAQPNYTYSTQATAPAPPEDQYAVAKLHVPEAQALSRGENVRIAVVDSGVDVSHPELAGDIEATFDTLGTNEKPHAHGTAVASLIVGHLRLRGVAPAAHILPVRSFSANTDNDGTTGTTFNILKGLDWAVSQHVNIINMSFAGPPDPATSRLLAGAVDKGIVLIAAAGNSGPRSPPMFPADDPSVIAVAATDDQDHLFKRSTPGPNIAVAAPGVDIVVAVPNAGYDVMTGTSFAAPLVSGVAALMLARNPNLDPKAIRNLLQSTAHDLGSPGRDDQYGAGLVDAVRAVTAADPKTVKATTPTPAAAR
jgi:subtilisin family serine protease